MSQFWQDLLLKVATPTVFIAVIGLVAKSLFSQLLSRDLERFKAHVQQRETEHKAELDRAAADYRAELDRIAYEHQIRFSSLHSKRAEAVIELYRLLRNIEMHLTSLTLCPPKYNSAIGDAYAETMQAFWAFFRENRLFFAESLCLRIDAFDTQMNAVAWHESILGDGCEMPSDETREKLQQLIDIRREIEAEFRVILAVSSEPEQETQSQT